LTEGALVAEQEKLTDKQFLAKLKAHNGNGLALAKELGVSRQAVNKRKARLLTQEAEKQGKVLAAAEQVAPFTGRRKKRVAAVEAEVQKSAEDCREQFSAIQELRGIFNLSVRLQREILDRADKAGEATTPKERYQLLAVLERAESILRAYDAIEKDIYNAVMIRAFRERVLMVFCKESATTQKQLYEAFKSAEPVFRAVEGLVAAPSDP